MEEEIIDFWADTISDKKVEQRAIKRVIRNRDLHLKKASALSQLCEKPKEGEQYRIVTEKQFNAFAVILNVLKDEIIEELYLAIYRINEPTVSDLIDYIESGKIKKAYFVISNYFNQTKKPEKWALRLKDFADKNKNTKHIYIHNHSKVLAVKTTKNHYVFEGSGNMSDNARIEQYLYENNKFVFEFHKGWIKELCDGGKDKT